MSAQIPSTMLLSDLLKSTGYDCPEELQGRTFAEATAGGDVQTNKASTIDVSAYTEPIVIKPDTDYESMKQLTASLSNIPQTKTEVALEATENKTYTPEEGKVYNSVVVNVPVGTTKLFAWGPAGSGSSTYLAYTTTDTPEVGDHVYYEGGSNPVRFIRANITVVGADHSTISFGGADAVPRYSTGDITF